MRACSGVPDGRCPVIDTKGLSMKKSCACVVRAFVSGVLLVAPLYLAVLLLFKAMHSVMGVVRPLAMMLPAWVPAEHVLSLLLVVLVCVLIGVTVRTPA